jgi:hypothetical protein
VAAAVGAAAAKVAASFSEEEGAPSAAAAAATKANAQRARTAAAHFRERWSMAAVFLREDRRKNEREKVEVEVEKN